MLKGLVSLITGGASGLGRKTVQLLAKHGGSVVLVDLPSSDGQKVAEELEGNVIFVPCDVGSETDVAAAIDVCEQQFGRLDLAVSCAGRFRAFKMANPYRSTLFSLEDVDMIFKSHVYGTFNVVRLASVLMAKNTPHPTHGGRGVIINTGGLEAEHGTIGQTALAAAKGAIVAMTLPIARELAPLAIRAVTISPGYFDTPPMSEMALTMPVLQYYTNQCLFPARLGRSIEFADAVRDVVENPMLNGENIKITGGLRPHVHIRGRHQQGAGVYDSESPFQLSEGKDGRPIRRPTEKSAESS